MNYLGILSLASLALVVRAGDVLLASSDPVCVPSANPLGECGCEGQLFVNDDCTVGFWCTDNVDPFYDGCLQKCDPGEILVVDVATKTWACENADDTNKVCPGQFKIHCDTDSVGNNFNSSICECDGQLWVSPDCKESFFCYNRLPQGGKSLNCEDNQVVSVDIGSFSWDCADDIGQCPQMGGFKVGCTPGAPTLPPPDLECDYAVNPLGTCDCDQQVFINEDCSESFYCSDYTPDDTTDGCYKKCDEGEIVMLNIANRTWECQPKPEGFICPGKFNVDCPDENNEVEIKCECEKQTWMNADCSRAFLCSGPQITEGSNPGYSASCPAGKIVDIDFYKPFVYGCSDDVNKCPGSFHFGCIGGDIPDITPICEYGPNTLGECKCDGQLFINGDCTEGFYCSSAHENAEGCSRKCLDGQILLPDIPNNTWECKDPSEEFQCPGKFNINCPEDDVGSDFTFENCECDGQLWVSASCQEAFYCYSRDPAGGKSLTCNADQIVEIDFNRFEWQCTSEIDKCPGLGGFTMGCQEGSPTPPLPTVDCPFVTNPLGTCGCSDQVFINEDCSQGFYCTDQAPQENGGCLLECGPGEVVYMRPADFAWECRDDTDFICPGKFEVDCPSGDNEFKIECGCEGEVWMNQECNQAFYCSGPQDSSGSNPGYMANCPDGKVIEIDFYNPFVYGCSDNSNKCPGSFHFGCIGGNVPDPSDLTPICEYGPNTLGECKCDGQLFINGDCTEGFYCSSAQGNTEGCSRKCLDGQILLPDIPNNTWECKDPSDEFQCPGKFNINCPEDDVGSDFTFDNCECDGQLWVSASCQEAFYCYSRDPTGGKSLKCNADQIVEIDFNRFQWQCTTETDKCPGLGGFTMGCQDGSPTPPLPPVDCPFVTNPLGTCGCNDQVFINEDCSQGFYCTDQSQQENGGCLLECGPGEVVYMRPADFAWECRDDTDFICPGKFEVDCPSGDNDFIIECGCDGEVWMNQACNQAFYCSGSQDSSGNNPGYIANCADGKVIDIDFYNPFVYGCSEEVTKCPGSFHFGCNGGNIPTPSNPPPGSGAQPIFISLASVCLSLIILLGSA